MIYVEYPQTEIWKQINRFFAILTYLSIFTIVVWSYFKESSYYFRYIYISEFFFSFLFMIDYLVRLHLSKYSRKFIKNFFSITDFISFMPFIVWLIIWFSWYSAVFNIFRLCRVLRIFKVGKYGIFLKELWNAVKKNIYKYNIAFTLFFIVWLIWSFLIYSIETSTNPMFQHIPDAMRWSVVTMATLWYWDKVPITLLWKFVASFIIIFWPIFLSIITSITIVTFLDVIKFLKKNENGTNEVICNNCYHPINSVTDNYCGNCWSKL